MRRKDEGASSVEKVRQKEKESWEFPNRANIHRRVKPCQDYSGPEHQPV